MEKDLMNVLGGLGLVILSGLTGHNYHQIMKLKEDKIDTHDKFRSKTDCAHLCGMLNKTMEEMTKEMRHGFDRVYDKMDKKEDKE